jgi:hypothetical protein
MPPTMPVTNLAGRDGSAAPSRFDLRSNRDPVIAGGRLARRIRRATASPTAD